jgi:glycerophosphoryl diester phosphodiesterase
MVLAPLEEANFIAYATLDEYLDVFVGTNTRPQIEIKSETYDMLYTVVEAIEEKNLVEQSIVISFDLEQLKAIHELNSNIELWYLIDEITPEAIADAKHSDGVGGRR